MASSSTPSSKKRERGGNFTTAEKDLVADLLEEHPAAISKKTDKVSLKEKEKEWAIITKKLNAAGLGMKRTEAQLKNCLKTMKTRAKSQYALLKREQRKTGGGVPDISDLSPISNKIINLIPNEIKDIPNQWDDDFVGGTDPDNSDPQQNDSISGYASSLELSSLQDHSSQSGSSLNSGSLLLVTNNPVSGSPQHSTATSGDEVLLLPCNDEGPLDHASVEGCTLYPATTPHTYRSRQPGKRVASVETLKTEVLQKKLEAMEQERVYREKEDERKQLEHNIKMRLYEGKLRKLDSPKEQ